MCYISSPGCEAHHFNMLQLGRRRYERSHWCTVSTSAPRPRCHTNDLVRNLVVDIGFLSMVCYQYDTLTQSLIKAPEVPASRFTSPTLYATMSQAVPILLTLDT